MQNLIQSHGHGQGQLHLSLVFTITKTKKETDPDVSKINVTILLHPTSSRFASHSDLKKPQNNHYRINACFVILGKAASFWPLTWLNVR